MQITYTPSNDIKTADVRKLPQRFLAGQTVTTEGLAGSLPYPAEGTAGSRIFDNLCWVRCLDVYTSKRPKNRPCVSGEITPQAFIVFDVIQSCAKNTR